LQASIRKALSAVYPETYWVKELAHIHGELLEQITAAQLVKKFPALF
jgi:hypothetical protein